VESYQPGQNQVGKVVLLRYSKDRELPSETVLDQDYDLIRSTGDTSGWGLKGQLIYKTHDGGVHWDLVANLQLEAGERVLQAQQFGDELAVGSSKGRLFYITEKSWKELPRVPNDRIYSVSFTGGSSALAVTMN